MSLAYIGQRESFSLRRNRCMALGELHGVKHSKAFEREGYEEVRSTERFYTMAQHKKYEKAKCTGRAHGNDCHRSGDKAP